MIETRPRSYSNETPFDVRPRAFTRYTSLPSLLEATPPSINAATLYLSRFSGVKVDPLAIDTIYTHISMFFPQTQEGPSLQGRVTKIRIQEERFLNIVISNLEYMTRFPRESFWFPQDLGLMACTAATSFIVNQTVLGSGYCGHVTQVNYRNSCYALKAPLPDGDEARQHFMQMVQENERQVLLALPPHQNIIRFHGSDPTSQSLVLEVASHGDLLTRMPELDKSVFLQIAYELAAALAHMHNNGVIYTDCKPENVLLDRNDHVKLADFGLSFLGPAEHIDLIRTGSGYDRPVEGTPPYSPPEFVIDPKSRERSLAFYSIRCDTWAYGCTLYEFLDTNEQLLHHFCPRPAPNKTISYPNLESFFKQDPKWVQTTLHNHVDQVVKYNEERLGPIAYTLGDIIKNCLIVDVRRRPFMSQILTMLKVQVSTQRMLDASSELK